MDNVKISRGVANTRLLPSENKKWELINFCEFDKYATKSYCAIHNVDENKNLGDITKVDENKLQDFNMICGGSPCFVAGTLVLTKFGYKPIEEIKIGDVVYTKEQRWKKVKRIGSDGEKEICSIIAMGILPIECTLNHPFWIKHKRRKWNNNIRRYEYYLSDAEKVYAENLTTDDFIGIPIISDKYNELYEISDELLWLLGRYVADGVISNSEITLSIGMDKISDFDKISIYHRTYKHTKSCYRVVFNKTSELHHFVSKYNLGKGAINKNIPVEILELPKGKLKIFLDGYWSGDGCSIKDTVIRQATTISKKLALMLVLAVQKVYSTGCKIYFDKRPDKYEIEGRIVNQNDTYMVRFLTKNLKSSFFVEDDFVWYPIRNIKKEELKKVIYNIEVEDDHTYVANGATVFNCQDFSLAGKQKGSVWTCNDCTGDDGKPFEYNPLTVHWNKRNYCPNCGSKNIEKTRSSLLVEYLRVVRANKPNFGIYENVKNIVGKQFKDTTFKLFTDELEEYGYNVYWKVLNAKHFGIPQNRERVYLIFVRKDLDNGKFKFPEPFDNGLRLKDMLEDEVDEKFYISDDKVKRLVTNLNDSNSLLYGPSQVKREGKSREYTEYAPTLTSRDYKDPRLVNENAVKQVGNISASTGAWNNPQVGRVYDPNGCSPTLNTCSGGGHEPKVLQVGKINSSQDGVVVDPKGISPTHTAGHGNTPKVLMIGNCNPSGNGMNGNVYSENGLSPTLTTNKGEGNKVAIKQATKQGYIECELGGVADLSYPDSKTRRGRVQDNGNTCPTITATETGVCRIEPKERFFNKDDVGSFYDYISVIFECLDCMKIATKGEMKNEERYQKFRKILYVLWEEIRKETVQWKARGFWSIPEEEILQSRMYGKIQTNATKPGCDMEDCTSNCTENKRKNIEKDETRNMWKIWEVRCSSYKLELEGQFIEEFASVMSKLSYQNTQNKKCMLDMWRSDERTRILQQALFEIQKIRMSSDEKEKSRVPNLPKDDRESKKMCGFRIRKLTPKEAFRLMGFSDNDFDAAQNAGISNSQLYKQAGNSIVVDVLYYIYRELYIAMPYLFDDLKLSSFFSGIGAFETGLDRLYKDINSGNFINPQTE